MVTAVPTERSELKNVIAMAGAMMMVETKCTMVADVTSGNSVAAAPFYDSSTSTLPSKERTVQRDQRQLENDDPPTSSAH